MIFLSDLCTGYDMNFYPVLHIAGRCWPGITKVLQVPLRLILRDVINTLL